MAVGLWKKLLAEAILIRMDSSPALEGLLPKEAIPYCH